MRHLPYSLPMALALALIAQANGVSAAPCSSADVKVTAFGTYVESSSGPTLNWTTTAMDAAACAGGHAGNDMPVPTTNLGYQGDGLLNGASQSTPPYANLFPGGAFITNPDQYSDLDKDGDADDPGWIMLGRMDFVDGVPGAFTPSAIGGELDVVLSNFFTVNSTGAGTGTWNFAPDADFTERAEALLGKHYFDQFALLFKAANSFAAYDFTDEQFGLVDSGLFGLQGTYDTSATLRTSNGKNAGNNAAGISHISLWARDPAAVEPPESVPEPNTLAMLGLAFAAMTFARKRPYRQAA